MQSLVRRFFLVFQNDLQLLICILFRLFKKNIIYSLFSAC